MATRNGNGHHRLTERQAKFVRGLAKGKSATQAAKDAGYGPEYAGREAGKLVEKPQVREYLAELNQKIAAPDIADASKRQRFWTTVMDDAEQEMKNRLKASELLGKAQGDFIERHGNPDGSPLQQPEVHVYLPSNGRGRG